MEIDLTNEYLTSFEKEEIEILLSRQDMTLPNDLEQMWYLLDLVWEDIGCDNNELDWAKIGKFYAHPVWLLNGLFAEQDNDSMTHRNAVSDWVVDHRFNKIADYGGGFGTLARLVAEKSNTIKIDIFEPYPSELGIKRVAEFDNIYIVGDLQYGYDCLMSTDVLEHVPNPVQDLFTMIKSVKLNGYLVIGAPFYPMIKCHLPQNFHFRHTFNIFTRLMGLEVVGNLKGSPQTIYKKISEDDPNWKIINIIEKISSFMFPLLDWVETTLRSVWRVYKGFRLKRHN